MFNNRLNDIKILVATDAVGMGLNLNISRIVFSSVTKSSKGTVRPITKYEIKQIAGRAGRSTTDGFVTAFKP